MPFQRRGGCIFHWHRRAWLTIWEKVKSLGTVRLMNRKRVTCELHDSYFRSMVIEHAIPKIELEIELGKDRKSVSYNSVKTGSQLVWRSEPLVARCGRGSQHPTEWAPGSPVEQHQENGKETLMAIRLGVNMLQFCSVSNPLSLTQPFQIKWEVYFSKRPCRSSLWCRRYDSACICRCICIMCLYS